MSTNMHTKTWIATGRNVPSHRHSVVFTLISGLWRVISSGYQRSLQRRHLTGLTDHQLRDIGLQRWDIELELSKPFWRE
jgi:uncharacterized protein YjiS (DUF1127 family)